MNNLDKIKRDILKNDIHKHPYGFLHKGDNITYQVGAYGTLKSKSNFRLYSLPMSKPSDDRLGNMRSGTFQKNMGVITSFRNSVNKSILKSSKQLKLTIPDKMSLIIPKFGRNEEKWQKIEVNGVFYEVDIKKAYYQAAYKLGYITKALWDKNKDRDEVKQALRECVTWLATPRKKEYYNVSGVSEAYIIECDTKIYVKVYENIRNILHNSIYDCLESIKWDDFISYTIDSVLVTENDLELVKNTLDQLDWDYKVTKLIKTAKNNYIKNGELRSFIIKPQKTA